MTDINRRLTNYTLTCDRIKKKIIKQKEKGHTNPCQKQKINKDDIKAYLIEVPIHTRRSRRHHTVPAKVPNTLSFFHSTLHFAPFKLYHMDSVDEQCLNPNM